jgi:hypothetical protein
LNFWVGKLSKEKDRDVFKTMGLEVPAPEEDGNSTARVDRTVNIFAYRAEDVILRASGR